MHLTAVPLLELFLVVTLPQFLNVDTQIDVQNHARIASDYTLYRYVDIYEVVSAFAKIIPFCQH